ncbi:MAG TPA: glycosyltransferase family 9 protein, partial [Elusimicrobiales bacterium]|nr:glycosyltransferase family 9 protein [Elusimicrobiales bacterium]
RVLSELRRRRFDIMVVPHRSLRSALLAGLSGAPVRVGFDSSAGSFLFTRKVAFSWLLHDLERNLTLALPLSERGPERPAGAGVFPALGGAVASASRLGAGPGVFIGANPGSAWPTKRWPREYWSRLMTELARAYSTRIVLLGGPDEIEWNAEIEKNAAPGSVLNLTGRTGMTELMGIIKGLKLFITNDSGPMHIAAAFGVPVAAIFGPTTRELGFFPYGKRNVVLEEDLPCRPCALHGSKSCPRGHFLCMKLITPDKVLAAAEHILKKSAAAGTAPASPAELKENI